MKRMIKKHAPPVTKKHDRSGIGPQSGIRELYLELFNRYCKLAERGDAEGQFELGMMFFYGQGVPQNHQEAALWFRKAAEQGHAGAEAALVLCPIPRTASTTPTAHAGRSSRSMGNKRPRSSPSQELSLS